MISKSKFIFSLFFLILLIGFTSAQIVRDDTFVPVASADVGSAEEGCFVASMASMLASLNHPSIGTEPGPIITALNTDLCHSGGTFPFPMHYVMEAAIGFLISML